MEAPLSRQSMSMYSNRYFGSGQGQRLIAHLRDWPRSSWSYYANGETGLIPVDRWEQPAPGIENPHP